MSNLLEITIYGNTLLQWGVAILYLVGAMFLAKGTYWFIKKIVKRLAKKTTTKLDDILVDMFEEPFVFAIVLFGSYLAVKQLSLPEVVTGWTSKVYTFLVIINATWFLARTVISLMDNYLRPKMQQSKDMDKQVFPVLRKTVATFIWGVGVVMALNNAGYDITAMIAGLGIGGLALAMAAQDSVSNFFGGFTILTDHPFKAGDRININGYAGTVCEIGMRSFRLKTYDKTEIVIPNSQVTNSIIENISRAPAKKIILELGLTYDTPVDKMKEAQEILKDIAEKNEDVINPETYFLTFGDFSLGIRFIYYINHKKSVKTTVRRKENGVDKEFEERKIIDVDKLQVQNDMNMEILRRFNEAGLNFAFPSQTVYTVNS